MDMSTTTNKANTTKKKCALNPYLPEYEYIPDGVKGKDGRYYLYYCPDERISQAIIFRYEGRGKIDFLEFTME